VVIAFAVPSCALAAGYPRIANLWGIWPQGRDYDRYAKYGLLVSGGGSPEAWRRFRSEMRTRDSDVMLLGTAPLMNLGSPESTKWMKDEWFLRRPNGERINWWAGQCYVPNLLIDECLDALLQETEKAYAEVLRDKTINGMFYDSVVGRASWLGEVDTNRDGVADVPAEIDPKWHERQSLFFDRLREQYPGVLILANDVDAGHAPHVNGRLFEGAPLLDRLLDRAIGPSEAVKTLNGWSADSVQPGITFCLMTHPLGWQGWRVGRGDKVTTPGEVDRVRRDFARMRTGLLAALMTDAYYAYDFGTVWYGLPFWYAEYDAPLGQPKGPGHEVFEVPPVPILDWRAGQPTEAFTLDVPGKVTPQGIEGEVPDVGGWQRLFATSARQVPLEPGKTYRLEAECEVLGKPTSAFQFDVRTGKGGGEHHDKGVQNNAGETGSAWHIEVTIVPDDFDDYVLEWHVLGAGALRLKSLSIRLVGESYWLREFDGGVALLNGLAQPITVKLKQPMRRLRDDQAPRHVAEVDDGAPGFSCQGAWQATDGEDHYCGAGYRAAARPGDTARWTLSPPSDDRYTLFGSVPGGKGLTGAAMYRVRAEGTEQTINVNQRAYDGGWVKLFEVKLSQGERCVVELVSGGAGATAADAIRAESAARYNDGATVESVELGPLDGAILLNG